MATHSEYAPKAKAFAFAGHLGGGVALRGLVLVLAAWSAWGAGGEAAYRFSKAIGDGALTREDLIAVDLDGEVLKTARDGYADVRICDDEGTDVPCVVEKRVETTMREVFTEVPSTVTSLREPEDNRIEVTVDVSRPVSVLDVVTPLRDFEKRVTVKTAAPGGPWEDVVVAYPIFDYSRYLNLRNVRIPLPASTRTRYRIVIDNVTDTTSSAMMQLRRRHRGEAELERETEEVIRRRDFRIDSLLFRERSLREGVVSDVVLEEGEIPFRAEIDGGEKRTVIRVPVGRRPLTGIRVETPSRNFSRTVSVEVPGKGPAGETWLPCATGTLRELSFRDVRVRELMIPFPERRPDEIRIVISDGDATPLEIEGITLLTAAYRAVFLGYEGRSYRLVYGSDRKPPVAADASVVRSLLAAKKGEVVTLAVGPEGANREYAEPGPLDALLRGNILLWVGIALAVAVLGWAVAVTVRRVEAAGDGS